MLNIKTIKNAPMWDEAVDRSDCEYAVIDLLSHLKTFGYRMSRTELYNVRRLIWRMRNKPEFLRRIYFRIMEVTERINDLGPSEDHPDEYYEHVEKRPSMIIRFL